MDFGYEDLSFPEFDSIKPSGPFISNNITSNGDDIKTTTRTDRSATKFSPDLDDLLNEILNDDENSGNQQMRSYKSSNEVFHKFENEFNKDGNENGNANNFNYQQNSDPPETFEALQEINAYNPTLLDFLPQAECNPEIYHTNIENLTANYDVTSFVEMNNKTHNVFEYVTPESLVSFDDGLKTQNIITTIPEYKAKNSNFMCSTMKLPAQPHSSYSHVLNTQYDDGPIFLKFNLSAMDGLSGIINAKVTKNPPKKPRIFKKRLSNELQPEKHKEIERKQDTFMEINHTNTKKKVEDFKNNAQSNLTAWKTVIPRTHEGIEKIVVIRKPLFIKVGKKQETLSNNNMEAIPDNLMIEKNIKCKNETPEKRRSRKQKLNCISDWTAKSNFENIFKPVDSSFYPSNNSYKSEEFKENILEEKDNNFYPSNNSDKSEEFKENILEEKDNNLKKEVEVITKDSESSNLDSEFSNLENFESVSTTLAQNKNTADMYHIKNFPCNYCKQNFKTLRGYTMHTRRCNHLYQKIDNKKDREANLQSIKNSNPAFENGSLLADTLSENKENIEIVNPSFQKYSDSKLYANIKIKLPRSKNISHLKRRLKERTENESKNIRESNSIIHQANQLITENESEYAQLEANSNCKTNSKEQMQHNLASKVFHYKISSLKHKRLHRNAFKCKYCSKCFSLNLGLNQHLKEKCDKIPASERKKLL